MHFKLLSAVVVSCLPLSAFSMAPTPQAQIQRARVTKNSNAALKKNQTGVSHLSSAELHRCMHDELARRLYNFQYGSCEKSMWTFNKSFSRGSPKDELTMLTYE